jgi:hypothetical protein
MSHFSASEFVDLLEGRLAAERANHVDGCEACRARLDEVRQAVSRSSEVEVPEPSPLFWEHLSARVREGIELDPEIERAGSFSWTRTGAVFASAAAAALAILIAVGSVKREIPSPVPAASPAIVDGAAVPASSDDWENEEAWATVRAAAEKMAIEDADEAGLAARPGAAETAMSGLTDKERERLLTLLEEELK